MSNNPFTIGEKAKLITNFAGLVRQGTVGTVNEIMHYGIAITFDGDDFRRVVPRTWLTPIMEDEDVSPVEETSRRSSDLRPSESSCTCCGISY